MCLEDVFEPVEPLLEFAAIACSQTRLLPLLVLAVGAIASAPATSWLTTVTFDLFDISYKILEKFDFDAVVDRMALPLSGVGRRQGGSNKESQASNNEPSY